MWRNDPESVLRKLIFFDGATCAVLGIGLAAGASPVAALTAIPAGLLFYAGLALLPIAAFMFWAATRARLSAAAVWLIIAGNALWVAGSLWLAFSGWIAPNALGLAFILMQAVAVAVLAALEYAALHRAPGGAAVAVQGK